MSTKSSLVEKLLNKLKGGKFKPVMPGALNRKVKTKAPVYVSKLKFKKRTLPENIAREIGKVLDTKKVTDGMANLNKMAAAQLEAATAPKKTNDFVEMMKALRARAQAKKKQSSWSSSESEYSDDEKEEVFSTPKKVVPESKPVRSGVNTPFKPGRNTPPITRSVVKKEFPPAVIEKARKAVLKANTAKNVKKEMLDMAHDNIDKEYKAKELKRTASGFGLVLAAPVKSMRYHRR